MHQHKHAINETKARSSLKSVTGRLIEITVGTVVQGIVLTLLGFPSAFELGFMMTLIEEITCFSICFVNERIWNKIDWGRKIEDVEE
jgi:hypothetical protein